MPIRIHNEPHSYRRKLPHIQPINTTFFITYRLVGSIPKAVLLKLHQEKEDFERQLKRIKNDSAREKLWWEFHRKYFKKYDDTLDAIKSGPLWLKNNNIARINAEAIHKRDTIEYDLYAYSIMPNHVHLVFYINEVHIKQSNRNSAYPVTSVLQFLKRETAIESNKILKRKGQFWERESYDHIVRNQNALIRVIKYTINNPVKAGLVEQPEDWEWNYCKEDIQLW